MNGLKQMVSRNALLALLILLFAACATVQPQVPVQVKSALIAKTGDTVQLFHGGSRLAKEEFCLNTVVPVYRYDSRYSSLASSGVQKQQVGKIRIVKDLGDFYVEGVVVEGSVKSGDIAMQTQSGCLISVPEPEGK